MGFFADGRDEEYEEQEERALDAEFKADHWTSKVYMKVTRWLPKLLTFCTLALVVFVYGMVLFRTQTSKAPKDFQQFVWNDHAFRVYEADPGAFRILSQEQRNNIDEKVTESKNSFVFSTSYVMVAPAANQLQVTVRYNRSMEESLCREFGLAALPEGEWFTFALVGSNGKVYSEYAFAAAQKNVNHFRCLTFEGVAFEDDFSDLTLVAYYSGDTAKGQKLFEMIVYDRTLPLTREEANVKYS